MRTASVATSTISGRPSRERVLADVFLVLLPSVVLVPLLIYGLLLIPVAVVAAQLSDDVNGPSVVFSLMISVVCGLYGMAAILRCVRHHWRGKQHIGLGTRIGLWCGLLSSVYALVASGSEFFKSRNLSVTTILLGVATALIMPMFFIYLYRFKPGGKA